MRNISSTSLAKLTARLGTEPIIVVEISWVDGEVSRYGDRAFPEYGVEGRILSVKNLDDTINFAKSSTVQNVSLLLDDSDGAMKAVFDNVDIHRRTVSIYQWFSDIPYSEKFILFSGVISSPITWKEGDRTLEFDILSKAVDNEIGFSVEDGLFPFVPMEIIGKAWPLIFGTAMQVPSIRLDALPHGEKVGSAINSVLQDPFGIHDPSLDKQIKENDLTSAYCVQLAAIDFIGYLEASFSARENGELDELADISQGTGPFSKLAQEFLAAGNKLLAQAGQINQKTGGLKRVLDAQKLYEKQKIGLNNGELFPLNKTVDLNIGGATVTGYFDSAGNFNILTSSHPNAEITEGLVQQPLDQRVGDPVITRNTMFFADAGTPVFYFDTVLGEEVGIVPIRYILACKIPVTIISLAAYRTVPVGTLNGQPGPTYRSLYPIPSSYYAAYQVDFGSMTATVIQFAGPLSARGEGWEDEIFATLQSAVGPNVVDIIAWVIDNYTTLTYDPVSFAAVRTLVDPYPANFATLDRPNAIKFIQDIAYQSRCIVFLKNGVFFIKYLAQEETPVETITKDDVLVNTLEINVTETEDLTTKYIAEWEPDYLGKNMFKIILRYNLDKYGLQSKTVKYFIYNQQILVDISATFWMIRESNSYKMVKFRTPITKLRIETLDTITVDLGASNGAVNGIVQKASFDSDKFEIEFEIWIPVRLGEMTPYPFFYTAGLSEQDVFPTDFDIEHGAVAQTGVTMPTLDAISRPFSGDPGNGGTVKIGPHKAMSWGLPAYDDQTGNTQPDIITRVDSTKIIPSQFAGKKPPGTTTYQYDKLTPPTAVTNTASAAGTNTNPGKVTASNGDGTYTCNWFTKGIDNAPTSISPVKPIVLDASDTLPNGTAVMITKLSFTDPVSGQDKTEYYMQPPTWGPSS